MPQLKLTLLGSPQIEHNRGELTIHARKNIALLAYLAVTGQAHTRQALTALLWPESDTQRAQVSLRQAIFILRKRIGKTWLVTDRHTIYLRSDPPCEVDVIHFQQAADQAINNHQEAAAKEAIRLYTGDFLAGFTLPDSPAFDEWQFYERETLRHTFSNLLITLINHYYHSHQFEAAIPHAQRWVNHDPIQESAHHRLMELYAAAGQRTMALRQYELCVQILEEELGIQPGPLITNLKEKIDRQQFVMPTDTTPTEASTSATRAHLPAQTTSFVGREAEIVTLKGMLSEPERRLITLTGLGGVGKTRLAIEVASACQNNFADGIYYVDLTPLTTASLLPKALADVLTVTRRQQHDLKQTIIATLQEKHMLLLLDNYEHLLADISFVDTLIRQTQWVKLLVTSRESLHLPSEWLYGVEGLSLPDQSAMAAEESYSAVQLFIRRARQADPYFSFTTEKTAVLHICHLVEGLPLAIELAAAWVKLLPVAQIAQEIARNLDILSTTNRAIPDRHRSIRAVFEHSWQRLPPAEQMMLAQLSLFRGSFTIEAATQITKASYFTLYHLVSKSLLQRASQDRHQLHELLRQFAAQKLNEQGIDITLLHISYSHYYLQLLHQAQEKLYGNQQQATLNHLLADVDNLRQAWQWAIQHNLLPEIEAAAQVMYSFHSLHSWFDEGAQHFAQAAAAITKPDTAKKRQLKAYLLARQGEFLYESGNLSQAEASLQASLNLYRQDTLPKELFSVYNLLANIKHMRGDYEQAQLWAEEALYIAESYDNQHQVALACLSLGSIRQSLGEIAQARQYHNRSLAIYEKLEVPWGIAHSRRFLGTVALREQDYHLAQTHYQKALHIFQSLNSQAGITLILNQLGLVAQAQAQLEQADSFYQEALTICQTHHLHIEQCITLKNLGSLLYLQANYEAASDYLRQAWQIASKAQMLPLALEVALEVATNLVEAARPRLAAGLLNMVQAHPAINQTTKEKASVLQQRLALAAPPERLMLPPHAQENLAEKIGELINT